jgi:hypothetical protein
LGIGIGQQSLAKFSHFNNSCEMVNEKKRGKPFTAFCNVISIAKECGYKLALSSNF